MSASCVLRGSRLTGCSRYEHLSRHPYLLLMPQQAHVHVCNPGGTCPRQSCSRRYRISRHMHPLLASPGPSFLGAVVPAMAAPAVTAGGVAAILPLTAAAVVMLPGPAACAPAVPGRAGCPAGPNTQVLCNRLCANRLCATLCVTKAAQVVAPDTTQLRAAQQLHCRLHVCATFLLHDSLHTFHLGMQMLLTAPQPGQAPM